jgi:5-methylcytosine-specific restriction endonuclease McrA
MPKDLKRLRAIYNRTDGHCHICYKRLSFVNYGGDRTLRGVWEIEHSKPRCKGGTDHGNNLYAACVPCNRNKSDCTTRTARRWSGTTRAPFSKAIKVKLRERNADLGTLIGGMLGAVGGPVCMAVGAYLGRQVGQDIKPPKA